MQPVVRRASRVGEFMPVEAGALQQQELCAGYRWGELEFPLPFGRSMTSAEEYVHELDGKTGASLKLSILNPKGRIWTMVAGGGASVIYAGMIL